MYRYICLLTALFSVACATDLNWRIIGGATADDGQFPYQISFRILGVHQCGGSIINNQWILSAAHCMVGVNENYATVVTGTNTLDADGDIYNVTQIIMHSDFDGRNIFNDIALLRIQGTIAFNAKVQPIALNTDDITAGSNVTLSGWGVTSFPVVNGSKPNNLQFIRLNTVSNEYCKSRLSTLRPIIPTQICTFTRAGEGSCFGDSGGPLVYNGALAGLVSWGQPCADNYPDVFTRISSFISWINLNIK